LFLAVGTSVAVSVMCGNPLLLKDLCRHLTALYRKRSIRT
jgi:hypothetical protein